MRTPEDRLATKLRKIAEREAHHIRVFKQHPAAVRYANAAFKKGKKNPTKKRVKIKLGIQ
jgi:hypothetical protein